MIFSFALLIAIATFVFVLLLYSIKNFREMRLLERVERQTIRKEKREFSLFNLIGLSKTLTKTEKLFDKAGLHYEPENTLLLLGVTMLGLLGAGFYFKLGIFALLLPVLFAGSMYLLVAKKGQWRLNKIETDAEYVLYDISSELRNTNNLISAITNVNTTLVGPLKEEFDKLIEDINCNDTETEALKKYAARINSPIITGWVDMIIFAKETGKNLAESCEKAAELIGDKLEAKAELKASSASSLYTVAGICGLLVMLLFVLTSSPEFRDNIKEGIGKIIFDLSMLSYVIGAFLIYRIISKEVK